MGVDGLIRFLQPIVRKEHVSSFQGQTAAIDMSSWLYRACYNASEALSADPASTAFLLYIHQLLDLLLHYRISMLCVFDGRYLPHKQQTLDKRRAEREGHRLKGEQLLEQGQEEEGQRHIRRCIRVDERVTALAMAALRSRQVPFMVSPYEADSQMAKLHREGAVDFAVCEDSDLIIYGVPVLLKLSNEGDCDYLDLRQVQPDSVDNLFIRQFLTLEEHRRTEVAVLAGTDYLPSIRGIGIKKALKFVTESADLAEAIRKIDQVPRFRESKPEDYETKAQQANLIFRYATACNPRSHAFELLSPHCLHDPLSASLTQPALLQLVGPDYGYDAAVEKGERNVWSLAPRELPVLDYDGVPRFNLEAVEEKRLSFENARLMRNRVRTRSSLKR
jgi:exonuclease 1